MLPTLRGFLVEIGVLDNADVDFEVEEVSLFALRGQFSLLVFPPNVLLRLVLDMGAVEGKGTVLLNKRGNCSASFCLSASFLASLESYRFSNKNIFSGVVHSMYFLFILKQTF
jgi:hypothetical protein